jgi:hypothetical protein
MKKGCLLLITVLIATGWGYYTIIQGSELASQWWIPLIFGVLAAMVVGNAQGILQALLHLRASRRDRTRWEDGDLVVVSGRLQALHAPVNAPISGKSATIVEYELGRISQSNDSPAFVSEYRGFLMAPCSIQNRSGQGQLQVVGFPLLPNTDMQSFSTIEDYRRIASFLVKTSTTEIQSSPIAALSQLNSVLKDDDGTVDAHFRTTKARDLREVIAEFDSELSKEGTPEEQRSNDLTDAEREAEAKELQEENLSIARGDTPTDMLLDYLHARGYSLKENAFENGSEVTLMGTFRAQKRQLDIGSGFSNLNHGIHRGPAHVVLGKNLFKALMLTTIFLGIFLAGNYFLLRQLGIDVKKLIEDSQIAIKNSASLKGND